MSNEINIQSRVNSFCYGKEPLKLDKTFEELKSNTPKQDNSDKVTISSEGIQRYKDSLVALSKENLNNSGIILTDYRTMISGKLPSTYGDLKDNGEYERIYQTISEKADSLLKAYAESYDEIQKGYSQGNRESYITDNTSEEGYKKLTKEEEIAELDKAYHQYSTEFEMNNSSKIISALANNAKLVNEASNNRAKIASSTIDDLNNRKTESSNLPTNLSQRLIDASNTFKVSYETSSTNKIDLTKMLSSINIFGSK